MKLTLGDSTLAVIGIKPIISRDVERVTMPMIHEMENLEKKIVNKCSDVCDEDNTFKNPDIEEVNYKSTLNALTAPWDREQLEAMVAAFPPSVEGEARGAALIQKAPGVVQYLKDKIPKSVFTNYTGFKNLLPSGQQMYDFLVILTIIDNPMIIFDFIGSGGLTTPMVETFRDIYPSIALVIDSNLLMAMTAEKVKKKSYDLPWKTEYSFSIWFNKPASELNQTLQANYATTSKSTPTPPQGGGANPSSATTNLNKQLLTDPQADLIKS